MAARNVTIQRLEAITIGKLVGAFNGIIGVVMGTLTSIVAVIGVVSNNDYGIGMDILVSICILLSGIIVYPIIAYAIGWIYGWLLGLVFNLVVGVSGGINMVVEEKAVAAKAADKK